MMNEFNNGEHIVEVTKKPSEDMIKQFEAKSKPTELTDEMKKSSIEVATSKI